MAKYEITVNGTVYTIEIGDVSTLPIQVTVNGEPRTVTFSEIIDKPAAPAAPAAPAPAAPAPAPASAPEKPAKPVQAEPTAVAGTQITAPMPGKILSVKVKVGDHVKVDDTVCTLEAMKMEMPISSTAAGTVKAVFVSVGDNVAFNDPLIAIE